MVDFLKPIQNLLPASQDSEGQGGVPPGYITPETLKQMRDYARALMPGGAAQQPVHHWTQGLSNMVNALVGANALRRTNQQQVAADLFRRSQMPTPAGTVSSEQPIQQPSTDPLAFSPSEQTPATTARADDPRGKIPVIQAAAQKYGIDPQWMVKVAKSEGLRDFYGDNRTSFGAMQLHIGGGLGDDFRRETGLDPADPRNEDATIHYAARHAAQHGWGAWMGARNTGIPLMAGIPNPRTRAMAFSGQPDENPNDVVGKALALQNQRVAASRAAPTGGPPGAPSVLPTPPPQPPGTTPYMAPGRPQVSRGQFLYGGMEGADPVEKALLDNFYYQQNMPIQAETPFGHVLVDPRTHQQVFVPTPQKYDIKGPGGIDIPGWAMPVPDPSQPGGYRLNPVSVGAGQTGVPPAQAGPQPPTVGPAPGASKLEQRARQLQQQPQRAPGLPQFAPPSPPPKTGERLPTAPATAPTAAPAKALPYAEPDTAIEPPQQRLQIPKVPEAKAETPKAAKIAQTGNVIPDYARRAIGEMGTLGAEQEMKKGLAAGAAKSLTDDYNHTITAGQASSQIMAGPLRTMWTALNSPNFYSGFGGDVVLQLKRVGAALGFKNAAEATELFKKAQSELSLDGLRQKLGGWGAGQIRLAEIHLVNNANANLNNSIAANKVLLQIAERVSQRSQEMAQMTQDYAAHHGGMVDQNWRLLMQQVYNGDTNPLFSDEELQNMYGEMSADPFYKMPEVQGGKGAKGGPAPTGPGALKPGTFRPPPPPPPGYK